MHTFFARPYAGFEFGEAHTPKVGEALVKFFFNLAKNKVGPCLPCHPLPTDLCQTYFEKIGTYPYSNPIGRVVYLF